MTNKLWVPGTVIDSLWLNDVNTSAYSTLTAVGGVVNAITAVGPLAYSFNLGVDLQFIPTITNTGATTININGLGVKAVTKYGASPLVAGDLVAGTVAQISYDGTQFQLINPQTLNVIDTGRLLNVQRFTASGTYTPTAGTTSIVVEMVGGGGGGGGSPATGAGQFSVGAGGGSGGYSKSRLVTGFSGATVTVGTGGTAGVLGGTGGTGTASSLAALVVANGGGGGNPSAAGAVGVAGGGGGGGVGTGNILTIPGASAPFTFFRFSDTSLAGGGGGASLLGPGAIGNFTTTNTGGVSPAATAYGAGAAGAATGASQGGAAGAAGASGVVIIYEYS